MYIHYRVLVLIAALVAGAALVHVVTGDVDAFEARTGLFDFLGTMIIDGIVLLTGVFSAIYAASVFFPRRWGEKAGPVGAVIAALVALFCFSALWNGGA